MRLLGDLSGNDGWLGAALASARRLVAQAVRRLVSAEAGIFSTSFRGAQADFFSRRACNDIILRRCRWTALGRLGPWSGLGALFDRLLVMPMR